MIINQEDLLLHKPIIGMLPQKIHDQGVSHGLAEVGYDIRIKQQIEFFPAVYHAMSGNMVRPPSWNKTEGRTVERGLGNFVLASAIEEFKMPDHLVGVVHDKSSWARMGLSVFNTVIEPGWRGFLTLELVYHGREPLVIPAGAGIAQVLFHQISVPAVYDGKYQDQADEPVPTVFA